MLHQLIVLKLNSNRLGEECTFALRRMAENNADLNRVLAARGGSSPHFEAMEFLPCLQVLKSKSDPCLYSA